MTDSDKQLFARVRELFDAARLLRGAHREAFVREVRAQEPQLADRLEALLANDEVHGTVADGDAGGSHVGGMQVAPTVTLGEGQVLGDYRLVRALGSGGMGHVWEAEQISLQRRVAIKFIQPRLVDPRALELFGREARAGGRLNHPGIVAVLGSGTDGDVAWIAMELVEDGRSLDDFLDRARDSTELQRDHDRRCAELLLQIAEALQVVHDAGIIHRDLKPQNVLLTPEGQPKLTDFGLAKITDESALSRTGDFAGTYFYMSPEQVTAKRAGIDHRTDVFSLGVVMYEMLSLMRPFTGDTTQQVARKILFDDPPDIRRLRSRTSFDLCVICSKAMEKNPARRYQTMREFGDDLRRYFDDEPIAARPAGRLRKAAAWLRRHPVAATVLAAGAALVSLLTFLTFQLLENDELLAAHARAESAASTARQQGYIAAIRGAEASIELGRGYEARRLLATCDPALRGWEWHHLDTRSDESYRTLREQGGRITALAFRQDGNALACADEQGSIVVWDPRDGSVLRQIENAGSDVRCMAFHPGGSLLAWADGNEVTLVDLYARSEPRTWTAPEDEQTPRWRTISGLEFSPDGKHLACFGDSNGELLVLQSSLQEVRARCTDLGVRNAKISWVSDSQILAVGHPKAAIYDFAADAVRDVGKLRYPRHVSTIRLASGEVRTAIATDHVIGLLHPDSGKFDRLGQLEQWSIAGIAALPSGQVAACSWESDTIRLVGASDTDSRDVGHDDRVVAVASCGRSLWYASGSSYGCVKLWWAHSASHTEGSSGEDAGILRLHGYGGDAAVRSVAFSPDGRWLASGWSTGEVRVFDALTGLPAGAWFAHRRARAVGIALGSYPAADALAISAAGRVYSGGTDGYVRTAALDGVWARCIGSGLGVVTDLVIDPQERWLIAGSVRVEPGAQPSVKTQRITLWDLDTEQQLASHEVVHEDLEQARPVRIEFDRFHDTVCTVCADGSTLLLSAPDLRPCPPRSLRPGGQHTVTAVCAVADTRVAWGTADGSIVIRGGDQFVRFQASRDGIHRLESLGDRLVVVDEHRDVSIWMLSDKPQKLVQLDHRIHGGDLTHTGRVPCLAVSPTGRRIATGSSPNGHLWLWETETPSERIELYTLSSLSRELQHAWAAAWNRLGPGAKSEDIDRALLDDPNVREETKQAFLKAGYSREQIENPGAMNNNAWQVATRPDSGKQAFEKALAEITRATDFAPDDGNTWNTRGLCEIRCGQFAPAIASLERSMSLRPGGNHTYDYVLMALALTHLDQDAEARSWLSKYDAAVAADPAASVPDDLAELHRETLAALDS